MTEAPSLPPITRIVCEQLSPTIADLAANSRLVLEAVRRNVEAGTAVLVLPELVTSGYMLESQDEARKVAITPQHQLFADIAALLEGTSSVVVLGFCEDGGAVLYNSAALVDATGVVAVYRKIHLWDRETLIFTPGDQAAPVVQTPAGRIGILVCYDLEFAEMPRALALAGAELIAVPTNWPATDYPAGEHAPEVIYAQAAARSNGVFIAACDRAGVERGQDWTHGSAIVDQFGWLLGEAGAGTAATAEVFLHLARDKAISPHNDLLADRRPDIYSQESPLV